MNASWRPARRRVRRSFVAVLLILAPAAAGCGSGRSSLPPLYKVTGIVTAKGGQSLAGGGIQFAPVNDPSFTVSGDLADDGSFSVRTFKGNENGNGAPEGEYRVTIQFPIPADQRALPAIVLPRTYKVEARDNHFPIEVTMPRRP
jgi:hypothetical protein